jgi:hypothetical protein
VSAVLSRTAKELQQAYEVNIFPDNHHFWTSKMEIFVSIDEQSNKKHERIAFVRGKNLENLSSEKKLPVQPYAISFLYYFFHVPK